MRLSRRAVQWFSALGANAYVPGFFLGSIYRGSLKTACIPVLNCYSCPGALFSCPVGAAQASAARGIFPLYVVGFIAAVGALVGRIPCGWLCPFGLFQELIHGRRRPAAIRPPRAASWPKFAVLALLLPVAALPSGPLSIGYERFCTYLCPAGTLQASVPLLAVDPTLRTLAGPLLGWRFLLLGAVIFAGARLFHRPFCRVLCPLGAGLGLVNRAAIFGIRFDEDRCRDCGLCAEACPVDLDPAAGESAGAECIRCLACVRACPEGALRFGGPGSKGGANGRED